MHHLLLPAYECGAAKARARKGAHFPPVAVDTVTLVGNSASAYATCLSIVAQAGPKLLIVMVVLFVFTAVLVIATALKLIERWRNLCTDVFVSEV